MWSHWERHGWMVNMYWNWNANVVIQKPKISATILPKFIHGYYCIHIHILHFFQFMFTQIQTLVGIIFLLHLSAIQALHFLILLSCVFKTFNANLTSIFRLVNFPKFYRSYVRLFSVSLLHYSSSTIMDNWYKNYNLKSMNY